MRNTEILVSIDIDREITKVGRLWCHNRKDGESASFEYEKSWLKHPESFALEPALKLDDGTYHTQSEHKIFGAIGDSAPDRWGRRLLQRKAKISSDNNVNRTLFEKDYLLGVSDRARMGALRFSLPEASDTYLAPDVGSAIPSLVELGELLSCTERFLNEEGTDEDMRLLLAPGSSLGGARPKASVIDHSGKLSIAKFPRTDDLYSLVLWEAVALKLAEDAKIAVPKWRVEYILNKPVLILERFDREDGKRVPFLSVMSMLEASEHETHSYLEIVYAIARYGAYPKKDMKELWRRLVFTIMISNVDDHLRNHGFLYERSKGWILTPVYDVNPTPKELGGTFLSMAIDFDNTVASIDLAMSVLGEFRLTKKEGEEIVSEVKQAVRQWSKVAKLFGLSESECDYMSSAFERSV